MGHFSSRGTTPCPLVQTTSPIDEKSGNGQSELGRHSITIRVR